VTGDWSLETRKEKRRPTPPFLSNGTFVYAEKEDPQPQVDLALGFLITNCSPSAFFW
jgi:hypothetical protein